MDTGFRGGGVSTGVGCLKDLPGEERWVWNPGGRTHHVSKIMDKTCPGHTWERVAAWSCLLLRCAVS